VVTPLLGRVHQPQGLAERRKRAATIRLSIAEKDLIAAQFQASGATKCIFQDCASQNQQNTWLKRLLVTCSEESVLVAQHRLCKIMQATVFSTNESSFAQLHCNIHCDSIW
jgi:hypothetical protein